MFAQSLRHGLAALCAAVAMAGVIVGPASAAVPDPAQDPCRLEPHVFFSVSDPVGRVFGVGAVVCSGPVFELTVRVVLTQGSAIIGSASNVCGGVAQCSATVSASDPAGVQTWCATATGTYQLTPSGPTINLGSKRVCAQG